MLSGKEVFKLNPNNSGSTGSTIGWCNKFKTGKN